MAVALVDAMALEEQVAERMGVLNAVTAQLVALIGEAIATGAWEGHGIRSPQHWVMLHCGVSSARAGALVTMARKLPTLPGTRAAFAGGELSEDQTRAVAAHTPPKREEEVLAWARYMTVPQLRRTLATLPADEDEPDSGDGDAAADRPDDPNGETADRRTVRFGFRDDGRWWMHALLPGEEGAVVQRALERARDAEFRLRHPDAETGTGDRSDVAWPDALLRLADAGLADLQPDGRPGERYQVLVHVDADAPATSRLHLGPRLPKSVTEMITCDCSMRWVLEQAGKLVSLSERQDTVDDKTRVLVEDRDGGCRVPGCSQRRWLHIHHLVHRCHGGKTILTNLLALCPAHHRLHHAGLLHIEGDPTEPDGLTFTSPNGRIIGPSPPRPPTADTPIPVGSYEHPTGERLDLHWLTWRRHPGAA